MSRTDHNTWTTDQLYDRMHELLDLVEEDVMTDDEWYELSAVEGELSKREYAERSK